MRALSRQLMLFKQPYRKNALLVNSSVNVIAAIFFGTCGIAQSVEMLLIGRFIVGIGAGAYPFTLDALKFQKRKKRIVYFS